MTVTTAQPGSECSECHKAGRYVDARRTIVDDRGNRTHLCTNHAAAEIHRHNLYDFTMNPTGKK
jgi:hypothetical protein